MSDQEIVESAVKQAEEVLRAYIQPRQRRDCSQTMNRLLTILANNELIAALRRIDQAVQISATIDGSYVVESVSDCESAFVRATEFRTYSWFCQTGRCSSKMICHNSLEEDACRRPHWTRVK